MRIEIVMSLRQGAKLRSRTKPKSQFDTKLKDNHWREIDQVIKKTIITPSFHLIAHQHKCCLTFCNFLSLSLTHTHTHTHTHSLPNTHIHKNSLSYMHSLSLTHTRTHTVTLYLTHTKLTLSLLHALTLSLSLSQTHTHTHTPTHFFISHTISF